MNLKTPAVEVVIHEDRLHSSVDVRHLRGCIRAALIDKAKTHRDNPPFITITKHSDMKAYLIDNELYTEAAAQAEPSLNITPIVLITIV